VVRLPAAARSGLRRPVRELHSALPEPCSAHPEEQHSAFPEQPDSALPERHLALPERRSESHCPGAVRYAVRVA
jgi:hypothetical protein